MQTVVSYILFQFVRSVYGEEACRLDPWVRYQRRNSVVYARSFEPYRLGRSGSLVNKSVLNGKLAIVFLHVSKCAGTTFKRLLAESAKELGLPAPYTLFRKTWSTFLKACHEGGPICARPLYAGTNALGACEYIRKERCIYITVLRNPIARIISSWQYFCVKGAEKRKGWQKSWRACQASVVEWAYLQPSLATIELSTQQAPIVSMNPINQTRNCPLLADAPRTVDRDAHLKAALANTAPVDSTSHYVPIRTLIVEHLEHGLTHLSKHTGLPFAHLDTNIRHNQQQLGGPTSFRYYQPQVLRHLYSALHYDILSYNALAPPHLHLNDSSSFLSSSRSDHSQKSQEEQSENNVMRG